MNTSLPFQHLILRMVQCPITTVKMKRLMSYKCIRSRARTFKLKIRPSPRIMMKKDYWPYAHSFTDLLSWWYITAFHVWSPRLVRFRVSTAIASSAGNETWTFLNCRGSRPSKCNKFRPNRSKSCSWAGSCVGLYGHGVRTSSHIISHVATRTYDDRCCCLLDNCRHITWPFLYIARLYS